MKLLIGCPVSNRGWILPRYIEHLTESSERAGIEPAFVFLGSKDDPTRDVIDIEHTWISYLEPLREDVRDWSHVNGRYHHMANVRNALLDTVVGIDPDYFLSFDSDILAHKDQVSVLLEKTDRFDLIGGKTFMTPNGKHHNSYAMFTKDMRLRRGDSKGVHKVDVVMAIKLMNKDVYTNVRYVYDRNGEDPGFCIEAAAKRYKIGYTGEVASKHVMRPEYLERVDPRCGF